MKLEEFLTNKCMLFSLKGMVINLKLKLFFLCLIGSYTTFLGQGIMVGAAPVTADLEDSVTSLLVTDAYNQHDDVDSDMVILLSLVSEEFSKRQIYKIGNILTLFDVKNAIQKVEDRVADIQLRNSNVLLQFIDGAPFDLVFKIDETAIALEGIERRIALFKDLNLHEINIISGNRTSVIQKLKYALRGINASLDQIESETGWVEEVTNDFFRNRNLIFKK